MTLSKAEQAKREAAKKAKLTSVTNAEYPVIGYTIWWTISQLERSQAELEAAAKDSIGEKFIPATPGMNRALRIALEEIEKKGVITRIPSGDPNIVAYTLHAKQIDRKNVDLDLNKEQTIVYNKAKDTIDIKTDHKRKEIMSLVHKYQTIFTEEDVRAMALSYIKFSGGVGMRENGGIYFVTTEIKDCLEKFITLTGAKFYKLGVPDSQADKTTMHEIVKDELERELQLATEDVKQLLAKDNERSRTDSFESRFDKFKTLRSKTELYKGLLQNDVEDFSKTITMLNDEVTKALMGELDEYPQKKDFPYRVRVTYDGKATDKYGATGTVIGYWTDSEKFKFAQYCKVLFDKTQKVTPIRTSCLKIIK
jgi:hypothetical protein